MKNTDLKNENWKSESGEAIIEATMVYPIVFFIVGFIILFGLYEMQGVIEYSYAQYVANYSAKVISEPGYSSYGQIDDNNIDFVSVNNFDTISKDKLDVSLYHRFFWSASNRENEMQNKLKTLIDTSRLLAITPECKVKYKKSVLSTMVIVSVTDTIKMPKFVEFIGIDSEWKRSVTATAVISDPAYFIRNTDLAIYSVEFILKKFNLDGKVDTLVGKTKDFYNKYIKPKG